MKILICGGRDYSNKEFLYLFLDDLIKSQYNNDSKNITLIHGAARGADNLADEWAKERGIKSVAYPANWNLHGKKAGPIRNYEMLKTEKPDLIIAFPGGRGTEHMISLGLKYKVKVIDLNQRNLNNDNLFTR